MHVLSVNDAAKRQNRFNAISQISDGDPSHTFLGS